MPCGCFGGGGKKKGSKKGLEGPPKPPKLAVDEPIKEEQVIRQEKGAQYTTLPDSRPTELTANGTLEKSAPPTVTTPQSDSVLVVDGGSTRSTGARNRAELYAKRREFFRPLYEVSLNSTNGRFGTPRSSNTLPVRGKRGGYLIGDGTGGYFTPEGKYVSAEEATANGGRPENGEGLNLEGVSGITLEGQYVDGEGRVVDRPPRPISQPNAQTGEWEGIIDEHDGQPEEEFKQKRQQIIQHQTPGSSVPVPPPAPKPVNPHFIEFQEKHHKILFDPEHQPQHRNTDPELAQKLVEERLTELDKLHNEVKDHYEKKVQHGPVDVDSMVQKYTEERWKKMVELWESEGLVVEGGIVVVDDKGNVVEREMKPSGDGGHAVQSVTRTVEKMGDDGEKIVETTQSDGSKVVRVVETTRETLPGGTPGTVVHTEEILVERMSGIGGDAPETVTTIVTPPTPQIDITTRTAPLSDAAAAALQDMKIPEKKKELEGFVSDAQTDFNAAVADIKNDFDMTGSDAKDGFDEFVSVVTKTVGDGGENITVETRVSGDPEALKGMMGEDAFQKVQEALENDRHRDGGDTTSSSHPQTCTPPPSPERDHRPSAPVEETTTTTIVTTSIVDGDGQRDIVTTTSIVGGDGQTDIVLTKGSATPPPSPPLEAAAQPQS